jgi:hypothetical protein
MANTNGTAIKTVSDFFYTIEEEIAELRNGKVELPIARAVTAKRAQQVKLIALELQSRRISRGLGVEGKARLFLPDKTRGKDKRREVN